MSNMKHLLDCCNDALASMVAENELRCLHEIERASCVVRDNYFSGEPLLALTNDSAASLLTLFKALPPETPDIEF